MILSLVLVKKLQKKYNKKDIVVIKRVNGELVIAKGDIKDIKGEYLKQLISETLASSAWDISNDFKSCAICSPFLPPSLLTPLSSSYPCPMMLTLYSPFISLMSPLAMTSSPFTLLMTTISFLLYFFCNQIAQDLKSLEMSHAELAKVSLMSCFSGTCGASGRSLVDDFNYGRRSQPYIFLTIATQLFFVHNL
jgi:hypothetical protein